MSDSHRRPQRRRELFGLAAVVALSWAAQQWWVGHRAAAVGPEVAALALPGDIRMLSSETCAVCARARLWFAEHRIAYSECQIERDDACRAEHAATLSPGTPVIVVRGVPIFGFSAETMLARLAR